MSAFTYGYGETLSGAGAFYMQFAGCSRTPSTWKEEMYAAARVIANGAGRPVVVCAGGGIGSEAVCHAFFDQAIHFSVLTLEHTDGSNRRDVAHAVEWCHSRGVEQKILRFDAAEFLASGIPVFESRYHAVHPARYFHIKLLELVNEMGAYAVLGSGTQHYVADTTKPVLSRGDIHLPFSNGHALPLQWCSDNATSHEPYFFLSTPELTLAYLREPIIAFALNHPDPLFRAKNNAYPLKRIVFQSAWPDMKVRYASNGLERVRPLYAEVRARLHGAYGSDYRSYNMAVPEFERQLEGGGGDV